MWLSRTMLKGGYRTGVGIGITLLALSNPDARDRMAVESDGDVLRLHVEVEGIVTAVAPDAGIFHTPERRRQMPHIFGIHPDHARFEIAGDTMGAAEIAGPDVTCKPIAHVVADPDRLGLIFKGNDRQNRPKDFLLRDAHLCLCVEVECRLDIIAGAVHGAPAAAGDLGAFIARISRK